MDVDATPAMTTTLTTPTTDAPPSRPTLLKISTILEEKHIFTNFLDYT